jgi:hypothetical protein
MLSPETLSAITAAAARCVPIGQIAAEVGMTDAAWQAAVRDDLESVRLAVLRGRLQTKVANAEALKRCAAMGKAAVSLFVLQRDHGWPKQKRGRPPRSGTR